MKATTDIWFTSFLMFKDVKMSKYEKIGIKKGKYYFDLTDEQWNAYKLEFNNSDIVKFKGLTEQVKDLVH
jgi:hypothetical protein